MLHGIVGHMGCPAWHGPGPIMLGPRFVGPAQPDQYAGPCRVGPRAPLWPRHGPIRVGPCWAGPKAQAAHHVFFEISLFPLHTLWVVTYIKLNKSILRPYSLVVPYNTSIWLKISLFHLAKVRAVPGRPTVPRHRSRHSPTPEPCRHGPDNDQAVPCLGQAKIPCLGPGRWASGIMANYTSR